MKITVQVVIDAEDGSTPTTREVGLIERGELAPATAGLRLAEAHQVLASLQQHLPTAQAEEVITAAGDCPECGRARPRKDNRTIVLRTLFGAVRLPSPRYQTCPCSG